MCAGVLLNATINTEIIFSLSKKQNFNFHKIYFTHIFLPFFNFSADLGGFFCLVIWAALEINDVYNCWIWIKDRKY